MFPESIIPTNILKQHRTIVFELVFPCGLFLRMAFGLDYALEQNKQANIGLQSFNQSASLLGEIKHRFESVYVH